MESRGSKTKKKIPKNINEMSEEMLQKTLKKKKECNAKALQVVEKLCETSVDEEWFLANLQYINQTHFDDVTIERAITKICGYPLCTQTLQNIPAQQYHISTRYNKVFDITERKNFCSSCCYKSAVHVKKQLFTSPLWFRDQETIPEYTVLKTLKSSMGEEVVFLPEKIKPEPEDLKKTNIGKPKLDKTIAELEQQCSNLTIHRNDSEKENLSENCTKNVDVNIQKNSQKNEVVERLQLNKVETKSSVIMKDKFHADIKENKKKMTEKESVDAITKIENSFLEWFSLDTFFYLYNEEKMKELLSDEAGRIKEVLNFKLSVAGQSDKIDRMIKLYGLLESDSFSSTGGKMNLKPLPDYSALKEEGKTLEIKVRAFYQGQLEIKPSDKKEEKTEENEVDANPIYMPMVDSHAQTSLRRKIVLDKLNRLLPDIIRVFNSDYILQMNEVRNLVSTFSLTANNITFKPTEWYLVSLFIIKLLSVKDKQLESVINEESSQNQIILILKNYGLENNYLDSLINKIKDSSTLMQKLNETNR